MTPGNSKFQIQKIGDLELLCLACSIYFRRVESKTTQTFCMILFDLVKISFCRYLPDGSFEDWSVDELDVTDW